VSSAEETGDVVQGFRRVRRGGVTARFDQTEAGIIRALVSQVAELVGEPGEAAAGGPAGPAGAPGPADAGNSLADLADLLDSNAPQGPPEDPALARLLPDAYRDDSEAAGEFRRFTEQELRSGKVAAARTVLATLPEDGGKVDLSEEDAQVWLRALNDVRLTLGVRLSITEDFAERVVDPDPADPGSAYLWIYDWLTFLQETLVRALR
jgi:Domain of unknown function (DUF2017)